MKSKISNKKKKKKERKCGICTKVTDNAELCQIGRDSVFLCAECCEDPSRLLYDLGLKRSRLSSLYGFIRANDDNICWKKPSFAIYYIRTRYQIKCVAFERGLQDSGLELEGGGRILIGTNEKDWDDGS